MYRSYSILAGNMGYPPIIDLVIPRNMGYLPITDQIIPSNMGYILKRIRAYT